MRFKMHVSQIQDCIVEQRVEKKRKIALTEAGPVAGTVDDSRPDDDVVELSDV